MEILKDRYTITELSERLGITDHALRYYEKEFRLNIPKDDRGRRFYTSDQANIMYQIKSMRDDGLEIKAIRKILESENIINDSPQISLDDGSLSIVPVNQNSVPTDMRRFFEDFRDELKTCVSNEVSTARETITREINKSKLEVGACVENSVRKLEMKMEKHFQDVDRSLGKWRERNRPGFFKRFFSN